MSVSNNDRKRRYDLEVDNVSFQGDDTGSEKGKELDQMGQSASEESNKVSVFAVIDSAAYGDINHLIFLLY